MASDDLRQAVETALKNRPELRQVALRKESNTIQKNYAVNQTKPQVNLVANYTNMGLGGTLSSTENPFSGSLGTLYQRVNQLSAGSGLPAVELPSFGTLPDSLIGGYGAALTGLFGGNYQSVSVGLQFDFNLKNRTAQANLAQSVIAERRLKLEQALAEQTISAQVRNAMQAIATARQRIAAAEASERAAKEKVDSETRLFRTGESTNFLVLTRQNEYLDSRRRVVVSNLDFNNAVAQLERAIGMTLESHHVRLD